MRKLLIVTLAAAGLAAAPAAVSANPLLDASCKLQQEMGYENVQGCNLA